MLARGMADTKEITIRNAHAWVFFIVPEHLDDQFSHVLRGIAARRHPDVLDYPASFDIRHHVSGARRYYFEVTVAAQ